MSKKGPLKDVIDQLLRAYGYQDQLDEIELLKAYDEVVGTVFVKHTKEVYFKNKILYVKLDSAALKQELSYAKETIRLKLNQMMGKRIVEEINIK
jgi:predicted nucleic acid-binding Zn ribbon protein